MSPKKKGEKKWKRKSCQTTENIQIYPKTSLGISYINLKNQKKKKKNVFKAHYTENIKVYAYNKSKYSLFKKVQLLHLVCKTTSHCEGQVLKQKQKFTTNIQNKQGHNISQNQNTGKKKNA